MPSNSCKACKIPKASGVGATTSRAAGPVQQSAAAALIGATHKGAVANWASCAKSRAERGEKSGSKIGRVPAKAASASGVSASASWS